MKNRYIKISFILIIIIITTFSAIVIIEYIQFRTFAKELSINLQKQNWKHLYDNLLLPTDKTKFSPDYLRAALNIYIFPDIKVQADINNIEAIKINIIDIKKKYFIIPYKAKIIFKIFYHNLYYFDNDNVKRKISNQELEIPIKSFKGKWYFIIITDR